MCHSFWLFSWLSDTTLSLPIQYFIMLFHVFEFYSSQELENKLMKRSMGKTIVLEDIDDETQPVPVSHLLNKVIFLEKII